MLERLRDRLSPPVSASEPTSLRTAITIPLVMVGFLAALFALLLGIARPEAAAGLSFTGIPWWVLPISAVVATLISLVLMWTGRVTLGGFVFVTFFWVLATFGNFLLGTILVGTVAFYAVVIALAGFILSWQMGLLFAILSGSAVLVLHNLEQQGIFLNPAGPAALDPQTALVRWMAMLGMISLVVVVVRRTLDDATDSLQAQDRLLAERNRDLQNMRQTLEERVAQRTRDLKQRNTQLRAAADIGRAVASLQALDELLPRVVELVSERFGIYHVGIFLVDDEREFAVLRAANSPGGQRMLARQHRLQVGAQGIVGYVTGTGRPRIALDVGEDAVFFNNPDLPTTRSEMALPLRSRGVVIGALDIQSELPLAFTNDDLAALQVVADLVAVAIENARLFAREEERLKAERAKIEALSAQRWQDRLAASAPLAFRSDPEGVRRIEPTPNAPTARTALALARTVAEPNPANGDALAAPDGYPLAVPLRVRGVVIGVLHTHKPLAYGRWQPEEVQLVETVVEQLGIALEAARLYAETQAQAQREQLRADLASKVRASTEIDVILQTAIRELSEALGASFGTIELSLDDEPQSTLVGG